MTEEEDKAAEYTSLRGSIRAASHMGEEDPSLLAWLWVSAAKAGSRITGVARACCAGLPLPHKHESLLAEMLFAQMLRLPQPEFKPLAYSTLMVPCPSCPTTRHRPGHLPVLSQRKAVLLTSRPAHHQPRSALRP